MAFSSSPIIGSIENERLFAVQCFSSQNGQQSVEIYHLKKKV